MHLVSYSQFIYLFDKIKISDSNLLAKEITDKPGDFESGELSQEIWAEFRKSVLAFLSILEPFDMETVTKKINLQPSPRKECIRFLIIFIILAQFIF